MTLLYITSLKELDQAGHAVRSGGDMRRVATGTPRRLSVRWVRRACWRR